MIKNKKSNKAVTDSAAYQEQQTPYGGCHDGVPVTTAPHLLVCGPTGSQKTTGVLAPGALLWKGPRVVVSSKTDFLKWLVEKGIGLRGPLYIMDLDDELDPDFDWLQLIGRASCREYMYITHTLQLSTKNHRNI